MRLRIIKAYITNRGNDEAKKKMRKCWTDSWTPTLKALLLTK